MKISLFVKPNFECVAFFFLFLTLVLISKNNILNTPYYWDEIGWAKAAYWLSENNLLRFIPGLHPPAAFWGHPSGLHLTLATIFKLLGQSIWLSHLLILLFSFLGVYFTYLLAGFLYGSPVGIFSALFLFFSPIYYAQSGFFLGDIPVTALGVASVYFAIRKKYVPYLICAIYMVMIKETGIAIVFSLLIYFFFTEWIKLKHKFKEFLIYSVPLLVITSFFIFQKIITGKFCCIYPYKFELFNIQSEALFNQAIRISKWLFVYQYRYIFSFLIVLNLILIKTSRNRKENLLFLLVFLFSGFSFTFLYFLPRYLLPAVPYLCIMGAWSISELIKSKVLQTAVGVALVVLMTNSLTGSPIQGNNEWNMKYLDVIKMHKEMAEFIEKNYPDSRILTIFPNTDQLKTPYLGYVKKPLITINLPEDKLLGYNQNFDLILISDPAGRHINKLREYVKRNKLHMVKRIEKDEIITELFVNNFKRF